MSDFDELVKKIQAILLEDQKEKSSNETNKKFCFAVSRVLQQRPKHILMDLPLEKKNISNDSGEDLVKNLEIYLFSDNRDLSTKGLIPSRVVCRDFKKYHFIIKRLQILKEKILENCGPHEIFYFSNKENLLFSDEEFEQYSAWRDRLEQQKDTPFK